MTEYIEKALKEIDDMFHQSETEWKEEFIKDSSISDDEERLLKLIEEKPGMIAKWEGRIIKIKKLKAFLKIELDKLYADRYIHYVTESEIKFSSREIDKQIKGEKTYILIFRRVEKCEIMISQIEEFLSTIRNLHWDIKNMIEIKKLIY